MATTHPQNMSIKWVKNDMIKAMKQALEALEEIVKWYGVRDKNDVMMPPLNQNPEIKESMDAITALRTAIEQAEKQEQGEPVAFKIYKPTPPRHAIPNVRDAELPWVYDQDPSSGNVASMWVTPVKATPPQRKPLTDEEILNLARNHYNPHQRAEISFARAIEAAHGIKE